MAKGFLYILRNAAMPGLLKIGYSVRVPTKRVDELFTTGVPEPFKLAYYCLVENAEKLEGKIHRYLSAYRHSPNREFFRIELEAAIQSIANMSKPEHEWSEKPSQSVTKSAGDTKHTPYGSHTAYNIVISSRHDIESEIKEMLNFVETTYKRSLAPYIRSLFYDSNSCCCYFEFVNGLEPHNPIVDKLLEIALDTIDQFEWFGYIQHGKPSAAFWDSLMD